MRDALRNGTEIGLKARAYMESGALVPDDVVDAIVEERLGREDCSRGFILDGYPRTIPQAIFLEALLAKSGTAIMSIGIEVDEEVLIRRLSARWTCPACGKMFNAVQAPEKVRGRCDYCGAELVQRKDDAAEVVAERLQVYHKMTEPLVRYYRERGFYVGINGDRPVEEIFNSIMREIGDCE